MTEAVVEPGAITDLEDPEISITAGPIRDVSQTPLPGEWSETGCILPEGLSREQWVETGRSLGLAYEQASQRKSAIRWAIGDWLAYGEHQWGTKWKEALEVLNSRLTEDTLRQVMFVAKRFENLSRLKNFPFWCYQPIAALESPEQRQQVLAQAACH